MVAPNVNSEIAINSNSTESLARTQPIKARLAEIDWSFVNRNKAHPIEAIHPYPAKFIGDIPRALLEILPLPKGTIVLDPFCGCGTTLMEAQRLGLPSAGIDLNPIACLIARVKTGATPVNLEALAQRISKKARANKLPVRWSIPNVDHWFKEDVQTGVAALLDEINQIKPSGAYDALRLALSSILVRVSNQDSDTRYAAIEKTVTKSDVFTQFVTACKKLNKALLERDWASKNAEVIEANTLTFDTKTLKASVGLVITSPPYPNAYEYWLYHKYRMWWLGFDPLAVKAKEIGARAHFFKQGHHTEENFWNQMRETFAIIHRVLIKNGYACFVIGRSIIHGSIVDNASIIETVAAENGLQLVCKFERAISASRKSFNLSHANIKTETILILKKGNA